MGGSPVKRSPRRLMTGGHLRASQNNRPNVQCVGWLMEGRLGIKRPGEQCPTSGPKGSRGGGPVRRATDQGGRDYHYLCTPYQGTSFLKIPPLIALVLAHQLLTGSSRAYGLWLWSISCYLCQPQLTPFAFVLVCL